VEWLRAGLAILTLGGAGFWLAALVAAIRFGRRPQPTAPGSPPAVSILKPVGGRDPGFTENIRSHARLDYPRFEILFGVADASDPSVPEIERLKQEFPDRPIDVIFCRAAQGGNPKVAILEQLAQRARHGVWLVDDADIRLPPDFLARAVACLTQPGVGLVTALYHARAQGGFAQALDAVWTTTVFPAQVLVAEALQGLRFGLGAAMLFRRDDLERSGGFAALRPYLADDYQLGARLAALGLQIALAPRAVETGSGLDDLRCVWHRHVRWSRTIRHSRPLGHLGLVWTHLTPWALALAASDGAAGALSFVALSALLIRLAAAAVLQRSLGGQATLALVPAADVLGFAAWAAAFRSRSVWWRERKLLLDSDGRIQGQP
jgi:ceramide glucosyltransferase